MVASAFVLGRHINHKKNTFQTTNRTSGVPMHGIIKLTFCTNKLGVNKYFAKQDIIEKLFKNLGEN